MILPQTLPMNGDPSHGPDSDQEHTRSRKRGQRSGSQKRKKRKKDQTSTTNPDTSRNSISSTISPSVDSGPEVLTKKQKKRPGGKNLEPSDLIEYGRRLVRTCYDPYNTISKIIERALLLEMRDEELLEDDVPSQTKIDDNEMDKYVQTAWQIILRYERPYALGFNKDGAVHALMIPEHSVKARTGGSLIWPREALSIKQLIRSQYLARLFLTGPSSVTLPTGYTPRGDCVADSIKVTQMTPELFAYIIVQIRFALCSVENWTQYDRDYDHRELYWTVVQFFYQFPEPGKKVLAYYDREIFSGVSSATKAGNAQDGSSERLVIPAIEKMQRELEARGGRVDSGSDAEQ
ncbi:hypothetical protein NLI96_g11713 [Meripilus lineatus]|uniref:Uncharacterized protein n=1 Tax=Meripilus lineatus TaxID=2056292 RepID=A0AAD5URD7_9APHY|nr:hypothetical protein NLI96_g11713 [Physisporinus lineatus]